MAPLRRRLTAELMSATFRLLKTISFAMLMQTMEERPTETRLDFLEKRMDERFDHVGAELTRIDNRFDQVDAEFTRIDKRFDQVTENFARVDTDIRELRGDVKSVQRSVLYGFITTSGIMVTGFLTLAGLQIF
jgi:archaellum component FlaC